MGWQLSSIVIRLALLLCVSCGLYNRLFILFLFGVGLSQVKDVCALFYILLALFLVGWELRHVLVVHLQLVVVLVILEFLLNIFCHVS